MPDYSVISFPSLGIELNPPKELSLGAFSIRFYGIIIAVGLLLAVIYALRRCAQFGISSDDLIDGILWVLPLSLICTRAYYCIFNWKLFADDPISVLYIWNGGLAIYGAVIGAMIGTFFFCRAKKLRVTAVLDLVALGFMIGQCIGRWGNFMNREAFGTVTDSFLRMGLLNTATNTVEYHHPTFLYESVWNLVGFVALHFLSKRRQYDGQIVLGYIAWYGLGRSLVEGLRTDSLYWGTFRVSQMLAAVTCVIATAILVYQAFRPHDPEKLYVRQREKAAEAEAEPAEEANDPPAED